MIRAHTVSYAQNREDIILSGFFDDDEKGFYVDVGANEPTHESVTKYFYDRGWSGINIEPIPVLYEKLATERPRDINVNLGIGTKEQTASLHYYPHGDGLSTISTDMAKEYKGKSDEAVKDEQILKVKVVPLKKVLQEHAANKKISFLKVDVEGLEYDVLASNDWEKFRPEVICIEANHVYEDWHPLLKKEGYEKVHFDGLNEYFAHKDSGRAKKFNYVRSVIYKEPIMNFRLLKDYEEYEEIVHWLDGEKKALLEEVRHKNEKIRRLESELNEIQTFTKHLKKSFKVRARGLDTAVMKRLDKKANYQAQELENTSRAILEQAQDYDARNFTRYAKTYKKTLPHKAYTSSKRTALKVVRKAMKK